MSGERGRAGKSGGIKSEPTLLLYNGQRMAGVVKLIRIRHPICLTHRPSGLGIEDRTHPALRAPT
jgi:hypothetical protein